MSGTVWLLDSELTQHGPWQWDGDIPPSVVERLRPRLPELADRIPPGAVPLDTVRFKLVVSSNVVDSHTEWSAIYMEDE